jgi:hypothetical protein
MPGLYNGCCCLTSRTVFADLCIHLSSFHPFGAGIGKASLNLMGKSRWAARLSV